MADTIAGVLGISSAWLLYGHGTPDIFVTTTNSVSYEDLVDEANLFEVLAAVLETVVRDQGLSLNRQQFAVIHSRVAAAVLKQWPAGTRHQHSLLLQVMCELILQGWDDLK